MASSTRFQHRQVGFGEKFSFSYALFAEQMVYQSFYPFSIFIVLICRGMAAAYNMRFFFSCADQGSVVGFIIAMVVATTFFCPVCLWPFVRAPTTENGGAAFVQVLDTEFTVLLLVALFQRAAVSIKYSYMGSRYQRFMSTRLHSSETLSEQLLTGWVDIKPQLLIQEMDDAMRRIGLTHDDHFFIVPRRNVAGILRSLRCEEDASGIVPIDAQPSKVDASASSHATDSPGRSHSATAGGGGGGCVAIRISWLARALISRANTGAARMHKWLTRLLMFLSIVGALSPMIVRLCFSMPAFGYTAAQRAALVSCAIVAVFFNSIVGAYQRVAIKDYRRRTNSMRRLARLCSPDFREGRDLCRSSFALQQPAASLLSDGAAHTARAATAAASSFHSASSPSARSSEHFTSNPMADAEAAAGVATSPSTSQRAGGGSPMQQRRARGSAAVPSFAGPRPASLAPPSSLRASISAARSLLPNGKRLVVSQLIPLDEPGNAMAFLLTRRLLLNFGGRFFKRLQAYQSLSLGLTLAIAVSLLASAIVNRGIALSQSAPIALYAALSLFYFVVLMCLVLICLRYGAIANSMAEEHAALLRARRLEVLQDATAAAANGDNVAAARCAHTACVLDGVASTLHADAALEPVLIVGVPASFGLLRALSASLLSIATAVVKLLTD